MDHAPSDHRAHALPNSRLVSFAFKTAEGLEDRELRARFHPECQHIFADRTASRASILAFQHGSQSRSRDSLASSNKHRFAAKTFIQGRKLGSSQNSDNRFSSSFVVFNALQMDTGLHLPCRGIPTERKAGSVRCLCEETTMSELLSHLRHDQIARLAYELWERNGRPAGSAERDWLLAEQILEVLDPTKPAFGAFSFEANERLRSWGTSDVRAPGGCRQDVAGSRHFWTRPWTIL